MTSLKYLPPLLNNSKQLRLLTILPARDFADDVRCLLHQADLDAAVPPLYETISYVWGDPSDTGRLLVDGNIVFPPASSVAALRRMRRRDTSRTVWLDAICINQRDERERSHQVSMMGDIYRHGVGNLIYLGEQDIVRALLSVDAILEEVEATPDALSQIRNDAGAWQYASSGITARFDAKALFELYALPWFRRLWVLQEASLTKKNTCFCGSTTVELVRLTRVAAWLIYKYYFVDADLRLQCSYAADMNDLVDEVFGFYRTSNGRPASVLYLLDLAQQRLSSVAVDKVYGILGLAAGGPGQSELRIRPDYSRSTAEVYREAAWSVMESRGDLEILDYVRHWTHEGQLEIDDFSSWVPKWHRSKDLDEHSNFMSLTFDACLGKKAIISGQAEALRSNSTTLTASGLHVGTIIDTSERIKCGEDGRSEYLKLLLGQVETKLNGLRPEYGNGHSPGLDAALAFTLCAGVDSSYRPADEDLVHSYRMFRDDSSEDLPVQPLSERKTMPLATDASRYMEAMYNACMNRKFFTTSQGLSGLGPHFLREGDEIVVLYGLRWPAVLRPVTREGNERQFLFLGTSYCHGIMQGEEVEKYEKRKGDTLDVFHIR